MNKKVLKYSLIVLILIVLILIFFGDFFGNIVGNIIGNKKLSRPPSLFDVSLSLEYGEIESGKTQIVTTKIINMGAEEVEDVLVTYTLWDKGKNKKISEHTESTAIQTSMSLLSKIYIPEDLPTGIYIIEVQVESGDNKSNVSSSFIVKGKSKKIGVAEYILFALFIVLVIIMILLYYLIILIKRHKLIKRTKK